MKYTIIFKHHYEREEWEAAADRVRVVAGNCLVCGQAVVGRRGWSKYQSLHNHLFEICTEYPYSNAYSNVKLILKYTELYIKYMQVAIVDGPMTREQGHVGHLPYLPLLSSDWSIWSVLAIWADINTTHINQ